MNYNKLYYFINFYLIIWWAEFLIDGVHLVMNIDYGRFGGFVFPTEISILFVTPAKSWQSSQITQIEKLIQKCKL